MSERPSSDAYWRPLVLKGLRSGEPASQVSAMSDISSGRVQLDEEIEALLLDALDDPGVYTFQERDWDDFDDEFGRRIVTRHRGVAEEAVKILGYGKRRERSVARIEARIDERGGEASERLYRALGELGPASVDRLLGDVEHPSERVRGWARAALSRAIHWSTPAQRFAILDTAIARLAILAEADDWLGLLEHAYGALSPNGNPALRPHVLTAGPDHDTVLAWLASEVRAVRAAAMSVLAHRALDPSVRALLAGRIAAELPRQLLGETERDANGHRRQTLVELALHILAVAVPEALESIRADDANARAALHDYTLFELRRPDPGTHDGGPWFVALALAGRLVDEPEVVEALRERTSTTSRR